MRTLLVLLTFALCASAESADEREIRRTERQWLNCYLTRDVAAMDRIEAAEFRIVYPDGSILTKAQELENLKKATGPKPEVKMETDNTAIHIYGDAALVTGNFIQKGRFTAGPKKGQDFRIVEPYTDVYVKRDGRWQVVASQLTSSPHDQSKLQELPQMLPPVEPPR